MWEKLASAKNISNPIVVQCRLNRTVANLYEDALSQLGIKLILEQTQNNSLKGSVEATQEADIALLLKLGGKQRAEGEFTEGTKVRPVGEDFFDLRFIAEIIRESKRSLVIEDFHYLSAAERRKFAFDLKALWDYRAFVVIIGVWAENNLLLHLNPDLTGRVHELSIYWSEDDLRKVLSRGGTALKVQFSERIRDLLVRNSFGTVGILQRLVIETLDQAKIEEEQPSTKIIDDLNLFEAAALNYADQLNTVYQTFARRLAKGIRQRSGSTGIYAHTLAVILDASDDLLLKGLHFDDIFQRAHERQPRIQKGNLRTVIEKLDGLQIDEDGRGLIITYDPTQEEVTVVDKQILLYRKYATVRWPWETIIESVDHSGQGYDNDNVE